MPPSAKEHINPRQREFVEYMILDGMTQADAYSKAYGRGNRTIQSLKNAASALASQSTVQTYSTVVRERAARNAAAKAGITLADSILEAGRLMQGAEKAEQYSAAITASKLRAQLAGHLVERKETKTSILDDGDIAKLLKMQGDLEAELAEVRAAKALVGEHEESTVAPIRRVIG